MVKSYFQQPVVVVVICFAICKTIALDFRYHNNEEMTSFLQKFVNTYPNLTRINSIGKSAKGKELLVVEITDVSNDSEIGVPHVKLIGNIHGNEPVGREILLHFLEFLVLNRQTDPNIKWLLQKTRIYVLPSLNPDGFEKATEGLCQHGEGRTNANEIDLNRSFPDYFRTNTKKPEPETEAIETWMKNVPFILSASLHGGALVANYPFESTKEDALEAVLRYFNETTHLQEESLEGGLFEARPTVSLPIHPESLSPDDDVFQKLATVYASNHPKMHLGESCNEGGSKFKNGITNGAAWYALTGGMQDYNYATHGCMEITLEISCCKYPRAEELPVYWDQNKLALIEYISQAHCGVKGQIVDGLHNEPIPNGNLQVLGRNMTFYSSKRGEFWRILLPGRYQLKVSAQGYSEQIINFKVKKCERYSEPTWLTITLYSKSYKTTTSTTNFNISTTITTNANEINFNPSATTRKVVLESSQNNLEENLEPLEIAAVRSESNILSNCFYLVTVCSIINLL